MISIENKFLFIHIPKTGGNSIQSILSAYSDDEITVYGAPVKTGDEGKLERFGVRYKDTCLNKHSTLSEYQSELGDDIAPLFKFATIRNPWDRAVSFYFSPNRGKVEWDKQQFMQFVKDNVLPIRHYLSLEAGDDFKANVDRIIKFEHLSLHFSEVLETLNLNEKSLPHRNKANKKHYSHYYDNELIEFIGDHFIEDVKLGSYQYNK